MTNTEIQKRIENATGLRIQVTSQKPREEWQAIATTKIETVNTYGHKTRASAVKTALLTLARKFNYSLSI